MTSELSGIPSRPTARDWLLGLTLGTLAGAVFLGVGGRIAMRVIAIIQEWTLSFSVAGSATVVVMGALAGFAGSAAYLAARSIPRLPRGLAPTVFWVFVVLMSLRVLRPLDRDRLLAFFPVVIAYGLTQQLGSPRLFRRGLS
jgi:hypothetical protein